MILSPDAVVAWLVLGLITGHLAGHIMQGSGSGFARNVLLGVVGACLGGLLASVLGLHGTPGAWGTISLAFIGAVVLLAVLHVLAPRHVL